MDERGLDVLLVTSPHEMAGGYVRWFSDIVVTDQPVTLIFPRDEPMTLVQHGPFGGDQEISPDEHDTLRGVGRVLTTPMFPAAALYRPIRRGAARARRWRRTRTRRSASSASTCSRGRRSTASVARSPTRASSTRASSSTG